MKKSCLFQVITISLLSTGCATLSGSGDNVDLDKYSFNANYLDLPHRALDTSYRTYYVKIEATPGVALSFLGEKPEDMVAITGWRKLVGNAHINVIPRCEEVLIDNTDIMERAEAIKDKNGVQTGTRKYYYVRISYTFAAQVKVTDYKGNILLNYSLANRESKQTFNTQEFSTYNDASYYWKYQFLIVTREIIRKEVAETLRQLSTDLTYNYGFTPRSVNDFLWIVDLKKHPEYYDHRKAWVNFKQAMFQMSCEQPLDEVKELMKPVIAYFENVRKKYNSDSKGDRKMRYASCYNLAKIYYYLDDPDAAMREAGLLMLADYDEKDGKRLEASAMELKNMLRLNKLTTRHFSINAEQYLGPGMSSAGL